MREILKTVLSYAGKTGAALALVAKTGKEVMSLFED